MGLEVYLNDPGEVPGIGAERGKKLKNGVSKFVSPHGSTRYVAYVEGKAVSGLQVVSQDGKTAIIANVFTQPEARRLGYATLLLDRAKQDFRKISHASEPNMSDAAKKWRESTG